MGDNVFQQKYVHPNERIGSRWGYRGPRIFCLGHQQSLQGKNLWEKKNWFHWGRQGNPFLRYDHCADLNRGGVPTAKIYVKMKELGPC